MEDEYLYQNIILKALQSGNIEHSYEFAIKNKIPLDECEKSLKSLYRVGYVELVTKQIEGWQLTEEGTQAALKGTPEYQVYQAVPVEGISQEKLDAQFGKPFMKHAFSNGMKKKLFKLDKPTKMVVRGEDSAVDEDQEALKKIQSGQEVDKAVTELFKKRNWVSKNNTIYYIVSKGLNYLPERKKLENEITQDMIKNESWKGVEFKSYNWNALGKENETHGNMHPLMKVKKQFKEVLLEMGFEEMPTSNYVESCFWNFDTLFVPQKHPARDLQDTFYIEDPPQAEIEDKEYFEKIKKVHETGDYGSIGYQYDFHEEESRKLVFRTHTTAASARMLHKVAQEAMKEGEFKPKKFYSIDRVFRNEHLDATHLAEFHQIEGIIADKNVGLGHLMGVIEKFFNKIGIKDLIFKPTYNPYTEPSLEIYGYHPTLKKMVEIGNSGVFRPEMLRPMGIPEDVQILGWGLGLERPTMIQYGYKNIRELFGDKVELKMVKKNAITCFK